ncbi:MAG: ketoacyl-ACP synthase III [Pyrinomonadaceae bacterium]
MKAYVRGTGAFLPPRVVTNEEIAPGLGMNPEDIFRSSGIQRRRWAEPGTAVSTLAVEALRLALADAKTEPAEIDYLIFGTMTPDRFIPGTGPAVLQALGLPEIPCVDIRQACCNALYALQLAQALIASGTARRVAICLAEVQSAFLDLSPTSGTLSMLFGDGASALIVGGEDENTKGGYEILDVFLSTNGAYVDDLGIRCPGTSVGTAQNHPPAEFAVDFSPRMNGQSVILQATRRIVAACKTVLERNLLTVAEVGWIVPHQANTNLLQQVAKKLGFTAEDRVVNTLADYGNTSSASMGIALDTLHRTGAVEENVFLLLPAFGAGFTWGAGLLRKTYVPCNQFLSTFD